eukprot:Awhi_evm1s2500
MQALFDKYCEEEDWLENGTGKPTCVTVKTQYMTKEDKTCLDDHITPEEWLKIEIPNCLGPLGDLIGVWEGDSGKSYTAVPAQSLTAKDEDISVKAGLGNIPGQPTANFHAIKNQTYREIMTFTPILGDVKNRGFSDGDQVNPECQMNQILQGVTVKLQVYQTSPSDADGGHGGLLHEEVGMLMYNSVPASGNGDTWSIAKMAVIPHGSSYTAVGNNTRYSGSSVKDELIKQQKATNLNISPKRLGCVPNDDYITSKQNWGDQMNGKPQMAKAPYDTLNQFLVNETKKQKSIKSFSHLKVTTNDISQTPFIEKQAKNTEFEYNMWISKVKDRNDEYMQLQYSQLVFFDFQFRFDCIDCKGATKVSEEGCYEECKGMDKDVTNKLGLKILENLNGNGPTYNDHPDTQHRT